MNRGVFALFNWTLRNDARLVRTHVVRSIFAGLILIVLFLAWADPAGVGAAGLQFFSSICDLNVLMITLAAISYFATAVTEETETETLGLLKLAGLGPFSILLGKSTSRLISALMLLLIQFPFTLLAITLGGVTLLQIVSCYVALGAYLVLVANVSLFCSVVCRTSGRAATATAVLFGLFFASSWMLQYARPFASVPAGVKQIDAWLGLHQKVSVLSRLTLCLKTEFEGPILSDQATISLVTAGVLFVLSCLVFERATLRHVEPVRDSLTMRRASRRRLLGVSRAWPFALAWKEFHFLGGGRVMWLARWVLYGVLVAMVAYFVSPAGMVDWERTGAVAGTILGGLFVLELSMYAARTLFDEIRWRTVTSLALLPTTTARVVGQKVCGCLLAVLPTACWLGTVLVLAPNTVDRLVRATESHYFLVNLLLFLHVTMLLSLFLRWGAMPVALVGVFAFNACCFLLPVGYVVATIFREQSGLILLLVTLATHWVLLMLPLELEIISRFESAGSDTPP